MTARIALTAYAVVAAVHITTQLLDADGAAGITQALLMPLLGAYLAATGPTTRLQRLTLLALGFSWLGDLLPRFLDGDAAFQAMIVAFLCAQVTYILAFRPYAATSVLRSPRVIPYAVVLAALIAVCAPGAGPLAPAVVVYGVCLVSMAVLATGVNRLTAVGGAIFVVSDGLIALNAFVKAWPLPEVAQDTVVMATYIVAQLLLVLGAIRTEHHEASAQS